LIVQLHGLYQRCDKELSSLVDDFMGAGEIKDLISDMVAETKSECHQARLELERIVTRMSRGKKTRWIEIGRYSTVACGTVESVSACLANLDRTDTRRCLPSVGLDEE